jgi:hypothetical protein
VRRVARSLGITKAAHDDAIATPHRVRAQPASFEAFPECIDLLIGHAGPRRDYHCSHLQQRKLTEGDKKNGPSRDGPQGIWGVLISYLCTTLRRGPV